MTPDGVVFEVAWGVASDRGRRGDNQDSHFADPPIFVVADGMGGHASGKAASAAVVGAFEPLAGRTWLDPDDLMAAIGRAAEQVGALAADQGRRPGSTLTGVGMLVRDDQPCWLVFNVGDSRTYHFHDGQLEQVSVDHSRVQELIDAGDLAPSLGRTHGERHVLTRAFGAGAPGEPTVDQWLLAAAAGDRILLCSDGLTSEVTDQLIAALLADHSDPAAAAAALVTAATSAGGRDNVTALVVDVVAVTTPAGLPGPEVATVPYGALVAEIAALGGEAPPAVREG